MDVLSLLRTDHKNVADLIDAANDCEPGDKRLVELANDIAQALTVHATLEEKFFYPELRDRADDLEDRVDVFEAFAEHDVVEHLIRLLSSGPRRDEQFKAEVQVLGENVKHHVKEEESTIFRLARKLMDADELSDLGERMEAAKARLMNGNRQRASGRTRKTAPSGKKRAAKKSGTRNGAKRRH